jgi:hypothetical protein
MENARQLRSSFCETFGCRAVECGPLPGFEVGSRKVIVTHPLWDPNAPSGELALAVASFSKDTKLHFVDTFNMQRRMSWAYSALVE